MSAEGVTGLVAAAILIAGVAGYADWAWWIGPSIGVVAGLLNLGPALSERVGFKGLLSGALVNVGLFGAIPYGAYLFGRWMIG